MTHLAPIRLDKQNRYRLSRGISEWYSGSCTECGWVGPTRTTPEVAWYDLAAHVEMQDGHPPLPPQPAEGEPWLPL